MGADIVPRREFHQDLRAESLQQQHSRVPVLGNSISSTCLRLKMHDKFLRVTTWSPPWPALS